VIILAQLLRLLLILSPVKLDLLLVSEDHDPLLLDGVLEFVDPELLFLVEILILFFLFVG
jgi:hypothetical protein